jgi:hypothetical protein
MDLLEVRKNRIVTKDGRPIYLRGTCIGGWMNMENFIDGIRAPNQVCGRITIKLSALRKGNIFSIV